jgi:hypothetical protein
MEVEDLGWRWRLKSWRRGGKGGQLYIVDFFAKGNARMFSQAVKQKNNSAKSKILEETQGV